MTFLKLKILFFPIQLYSNRMHTISFPTGISKKWIISTIGILLLGGVSIITVLGFSRTSAQHITGYKEGIISTTHLGKGSDKTPDSLQQVTGFYDGIGIGFLLGEEGNIAPTLIFNDIQKISEISSLLNVNVLAFLNHSTQRADALNVLLQELLHQKDLATKRRDVLNRQHTALMSAYTSSKQKQDKLQNDVFSAIDNKYPFEAEDNLKKFIAVKRTTGELFTKLKIMEILQEKYALAEQLLNNKIIFLTANRNALIKGVQVVDIPDPNIKLIRSKTEWEKTKP
jgi:hypothetical protein